MAFKDLQPNVKLDDNGIPVFIQPLSQKDLAGFSATNPAHVAIMDQLLVSRGLGDARYMRKATTKYLERFNILSDDARYEAEMDRLIETAAGNRVVLGEARRIAEREQTIAAARGNMLQNFVRVAEGDDPCAECEPLNGEEGTLPQLAADNMMPGDRCLGGNLCQCVLIAIDRSF